MSNMSYKVYLGDLVTIVDTFGVFYKNLVDAIQKEVDATDTIRNLVSFQGEGADSIKNYFGEVHRSICLNIETLCESLFCSLTEAYYNPYTTGEIGEDNHYGLLSSTELQSKKKWIEQCLINELLGSPGFKDSESVCGLIQSAKEELNKCGGVGSYTNEKETLFSLQVLIKFLEQLDEKCLNTEVVGYSCFAENSSLFSRYKNELLEVINQWKEGDYDIVNYNSGTFETLLNQNGITQLQIEARTYIDYNYEKMIKGWDNAGDHHRDLVIEIAEKNREIYKWGKVIAEAVGLFVVAGITIAACVAFPEFIIPLAISGIIAEGARAFSLTETIFEYETPVDSIVGTLGTVCEAVPAFVEGKFVSGFFKVAGGIVSNQGQELFGRDDFEGRDNTDLAGVLIGACGDIGNASKSDIVLDGIDATAVEMGEGIDYQDSRIEMATEENANNKRWREDKLKSRGYYAANLEFGFDIGGTAEVAPSSQG